MSTRNHIVFFLNGKRREVHSSDCFLSLSDFLRYRLALVGTKIVCSEGDCGSCTVLIGRPEGKAFCYQPIDSCICWMFQLDGTHVVTVEGLGGPNANLDCFDSDDTSTVGQSRNAAFRELTFVQQAMVDCHGSQCGFCTPGFVMAMTGLCESANGHALTEDDWRHGLTGNLCRCTGYTPILKAGRQLAAQEVAKLNESYPPAAMIAAFEPLEADAIDLRIDWAGVTRRAYCPITIDQAAHFRRDNPQAKIVAGATDVGVQMNKRVIEPEAFLDLNRVGELEGARIEETDDGHRVLVAGARATWTDLLELFENEVPQFAEILSVFGSPQIRHAGTIGGNIINASPIADSLPFLFVMEAELELTSSAGSRRVNINNFYHAYKKFDLRPDELLASIRIPLPADDELLRLFKISRRRDLDISTFTAAVRLRLNGEAIASAAIAYGAVAPTVLRLPKTQQFLIGREFSEETMRTAGDIAVSEISPISDVRGSKDYRLQLARNVLLKFYYEQQLATA